MWMRLDKLFTDSFQNEVKQILNEGNSPIKDKGIISED
jgi:hypothetical protein